MSSVDIDYSKDPTWFDFSTTANVDVSTERLDFIKYPPFESMNTFANISNQLTFTVKAGSDYIDVSQGYFQIQVSISKFDAEDIITFANPISHVIFRGAAYYNNDVQIEKVVDFMNVRGLVHGLMNYKKSFTASSGINRGWALDTPSVTAALNKYFPDSHLIPVASIAAGNEDLLGNDLPINQWNALAAAGVAFAGAADNAARGAARSDWNDAVNLAYTVRDRANALTQDLATFNQGFIDRYNSRTSDAFVDIYNINVPVSDYFASCGDIKTVYRKHIHKFEFTMEKNINNLIHISDGTARTFSNIRLIKMDLWIPRVIPSALKKVMLDSLYDKTFVKDVLFYPYTIHERIFASTSINWDVGDIMERPMHLYVFAMNVKSAQTGDSPTVFYHNNITSIRVTIGMNDFPKLPLVSNFAAGVEDYSEAYQHYLRCARQYADNEVALTYKEFKNNYPIFCFDFSTVDQSIFLTGKRFVLNIENDGTSRRFFAVLLNERKAKLNVSDGGIRLIRA